MNLVTCSVFINHFVVKKIFHTHVLTDTYIRQPLNQQFTATIFLFITINGLVYILYISIYIYIVYTYVFTIWKMNLNAPRILWHILVCRVMGLTLAEFVSVKSFKIILVTVWETQVSVRSRLTHHVKGVRAYNSIQTVRSYMHILVNVF